MSTRTIPAPIDDRRAAPPTSANLSRPQRFWRHPVTWFLFAPLILFVEALFLGPASEASHPLAISLTAASGVASWLVYRLVMRRVAHRPTPELAGRGAVRELLLGAAVGAAFIAVTVGVISLAGGYHFGAAAPNPSYVLTSTVIAALAGAVAEELAFRGIALQALERLGGSWFALVVTAVMFGGAHLANPDASLWSSTAIAIEAGGLMGAAFLWRRNLWFPIAIHATWNAIEALLGIPVSGHVDPGLTRVSVHGAGWLTGGSFGLEASAVSVVMSLALIVPMVVMAKRAQRIRRRGSVPQSSGETRPTR